MPAAAFHMLAAIFGLSDEVERRRVAELGETLSARELYEQPVRTLSLGQRMRCELTACMLHEPEILFLDEPTIGLDLLAKQRFREMLVTLNEEHGTTVFLTSHDVADIEHVASRAIVVNHGEIIYDDAVSAMCSAVKAWFSARCVMCRPVANAISRSCTWNRALGNWSCPPMWS